MWVVWCAVGVTNKTEREWVRDRTLHARMRSQTQTLLLKIVLYFVVLLYVAVAAAVAVLVFWPQSVLAFFDIRSHNIA